MEFTVAITGASGSIYALRTLVHLAASGVVERINLIMSEAAKVVARWADYGGIKREGHAARSKADDVDGAPEPWLLLP